MSNTIQFACSCCGQIHNEWPALTFKAPDNYADLSETEKATRGELDTDFCVIRHYDQVDRFIRVTLTQKILAIARLSFCHFRSASANAAKSIVAIMKIWYIYSINSMTTLHYIILADSILILIAIKLIFGTPKIFIKALLSQFFSDWDAHSRRLQAWEKTHDLHHKMNILYAAVLPILGLSFLLYQFVLKT